MSIRCIALDLDRTTLDAGGLLSDGNREALTEAIQKGIHIVIASGRAFDTLPGDVMAVPGIEYAVTSNGAAVYHVPTGECLAESHLPQEVPEKVLGLTERFEDISYECFIHGKAFGSQQYVEEPERFGLSEDGIWYMKTTRTLVPDIRGFILEHCSSLNSLDVMVKDQEANDRIFPVLREALPDVYMTSSFFQLIEISDKSCGKHAGLQFVAEKLCLERGEIAAFGDADNDIEMLRYAGVGIAMANATKRCREAADYHTLRHDQDGVAWGIKNILKL